MFKKKKEKKVKKPLFERIIKAIFILLILGFSIYFLFYSFKDAFNSIGSSTSSYTTLSKLLTKEFNLQDMQVENFISLEDTSSFYLKLGENGAKASFITENGFDYSDFSSGTALIENSFSLSGNELGIFVNNLIPHSEGLLIDRFLEINVKPIENSNKFILTSVCKMDISLILEYLNSGNKLGDIYFKTTSECEILGSGLAVFESKVQINQLSEKETNQCLEVLSPLFMDNKTNTIAKNYSTSAIKNSLSLIKNKLNCEINKQENNFVFNI